MALVNQIKCKTICVLKEKLVLCIQMYRTTFAKKKKKKEKKKKNYTLLETDRKCMGKIQNPPPTHTQKKKKERKRDMPLSQSSLPLKNITALSLKKKRIREYCLVE